MIRKARRGLSFGKQGHMGIARVGLRGGRIEAGLRPGRGTRALLGRSAGKQR